MQGQQMNILINLNGFSMSCSLLPLRLQTKIVYKKLNSHNGQLQDYYPQHECVAGLVMELPKCIFKLVP